MIVTPNYITDCMPNVDGRLNVHSHLSFNTKEKNHTSCHTSRVFTLGDKSIYI